MGVHEEKSFPRGGKDPGILSRRETYNVEKIKPSRSPHVRKIVKGKAGKSKLVVNGPDIRLLTNSSVKVGLLTLGCISDIKEFELKINMPGFVTGFVPVNNISDHYTESLHKILEGKNADVPNLKEMFKIGQFVIVKVAETKDMGDCKNKIILTLNPKSLHSEMFRKTLSVGLALSASVKSIEDHGYTMDIGIEGVRAFLKKKNAEEYVKNWNNGKSLAIGQTVRCLITKCSHEEIVSTLDLTANPKHVLEDNISKEEKFINNIIPGTLVHTSVIQVTSSGLVVKFGGSQTGYVHRQYLQTVKTSLKNIQVGDEFPGRILYVEQVSKLIYLTLRESVFDSEPPSSPFKDIKKRDIIEDAKVVYVFGGVILKLPGVPKFNRGFVGPHHIDKYDHSKLKKRFPKHSSHKCRVLDFDYMVQGFICSLKKAIFNEQFLSIEDCSIGDVVECTIKKVSMRRITAVVCRIPAVVNPLHYSDVPLRYPEKKFMPGKTFKARILKIEENRLLLTLKPSLLHPACNCIFDFDKVEYGIPYDGIIVQIKENGLVVRFFGDLGGFIPLPKQTDVEKDSYYEGQAVQCFLVRKNAADGYLLMSFQDPKIATLKPIDEGSPLHIGRSYEVEVKDVNEEGLTVTVKGFDLEGFIPIEQISDHIATSEILLPTIKRGDAFSACCLNVAERPLFTLNPVFLEFFESPVGLNIMKGVVPQLVIMPGLVVSVQDDSILLDVPIPGMKYLTRVPKKGVGVKKGLHIESLNLRTFQTLIVRVYKVAMDAVSQGTTRLPFVWDGNLNMGTTLFKNYLSAHSRAVSFYKNTPLGNLKMGCKVQGKVQTLSHLGAVVKLSNGSQAVVMPYHYQDMKLREGMKVEGTVMFIDMKNRCIEITLREELQEVFRIAMCSVPDVHVGKQVTALVLMRKPDIELIAIKIKGKFHIAYVPVHWHINDFEQTLPNKIGDVYKYVITSVEDDTIICTPRKYLTRRNEFCVFQINEEEKDISLQNNAKSRVESGNLKSKGKKKRGIDNGNYEETGIAKKKQCFEQTCTVTDEPPVLYDEIKVVRNQDNYLCDFKNKEKTKAVKTKQKKKISVDTTDVQETIVQHNNSEVNVDKSNDISRSQTSKTCSQNTKVIKNTMETDRFCEKSSKDIKTCENSTSLQSQETVKENICQQKRKGNFVVKELESEIKKKKVDTKVKVQNITSNENVAVKDKNNTQKQKSNLIRDTETDLGKKKKSVSEVCDPPTIVSKNIKKSKVKESSNAENKINAKNEKAEDSCLKVSGGFVWNATLDQLPIVTKFRQEQSIESSGDEQEEESQNSKKKKKRLSAAEKREAARQTEENLRKIEARLMDAETNPQSADDFDRLVLSSPNNSQNWIKYMAFYVQATEVEKARAVGERALQTINYREEQEKFNIWTALLNLENLYGTKESFENTVKKATQMSDAYKVNMQVLQMYAESNKTEELNKLAKVVIKKYKPKKEMWIELGSIYMKAGLMEQARNLMQQALTGLEIRDHISILVNFAHLENEHGDSERAETLMERILTTYPKRVDIWCSYVDMLVKSKKVDLARQILERAIVQKLPPKKMKTMYKKFVAFEQQHGTSEAIENIRKMAAEYVTSVVGDD